MFLLTNEQVSHILPSHSAALRSVPSVMLMVWTLRQWTLTQINLPLTLHLDCINVELGAIMAIGRP